MKAHEDDRTRGLLADGRELLDSGRGREAADVFGRVLLQDPANPEARRGLAEARVAATENRRLLDELLDRAARAIEAGERASAREILREVVAQGGDRDRALALLDRLDPRSGRVETALAAVPEPAGQAAAAPGSADQPRRAFVALCATSFACLAAGVSSSWERLVDSLSRTPSPASDGAQSSTLLAGPTPGERAISDARRLMEKGEIEEAVRVLDRVSREEPAYPFARQLREQIRAGAPPRLPR